CANSASMRFFRHGDVLAITLPESLRKKLGIAEGDEYDFAEVKPGVLALSAKGVAPGEARVSATAVFKPSAKPLLDPLPSGFKVLINEMDAKGFSARHEAAIKSGQIKGVRGFDKKFYLCSRAYFEENGPKVLAALKQEKTVPALSMETRLSEDALLTLVYLLKEEGEVIEKKRGVFVAVP
ncbi:MAG: AbrB/MazE/SpoVT family DNA-binding domain-containing protein, partial [Candidatus Micrarchaeota archaeon]|nr:AbrB/MazE/SpoVT family DNA-binding domain-containing protein [Candidatus Micrarchaeota archaeon]